MIQHIYITQVTLSIIMIGFCIAMIAQDNTADTRSVYLPILTSIVGVWLPQPQITGSLKHTIITDSSITTPLLTV
jgi:hypothetical protein